jgi:hypothetical protein
MPSILQEIKLAKNWRGLATLLSVLGVTLITSGVLSAAQAAVPEPPKPTCYSCPTGYHCAHNPERCVRNSK